MKILGTVQRVGIVLLTVLGFIASCGLPEDLSSTSQDVVSTNLTTYMTGQNITVNYTGMSGSTSDWISIALTSDPANTYEVWQYTGGGTSGSLTFTNPNLTPGTYEARAYYDWLGTHSFTIQQKSPSFTVTGANAPTVSTTKPNYPVGATVTVNYTNMPGNQLDWVAVSVAGSATNQYVQFAYTNGQINGSQNFTGLAAGNYEARIYRNNTYSLLASSTFSVGGTPSVATDKQTYMLGDVVNVSYFNMPGNPQDYIAVSLSGSAADQYVMRTFTNGVTSGTTAFSGLAAGVYEARAYLQGTTTILAKSSFSIVSATSPTVTTDASMYPTGGTVTVTYSNLPGNPTDWISISTAGSSDLSYVTWVYTNGQVNGTAQFANMAAGTYEARAYSNNTYTVLARSSTFTVGGSVCTPPAQTPTFGSISSGDIVLASADQTKSAALTVPIANSILLTSLRENEPSPDHGAVICELDATGVTCRRNNTGTDSTSSDGSITIHYSVITFTAGVTVQRGEVDTTVTNPANVTLTSVNMAQSFVLLNGTIGGGTGWGNNEFARATLMSPTSLQIANASPGDRMAWQVVTMTGATVQRGSATLNSSDLERLVTITAVPTGSMALVSYTSDNAAGIAAASLMLQSTFKDSSTLDLKRSANGSNLGVSWEVVSLPYATTLGTSSFIAGQTMLSSTVAGIAPATSVALGSTQSILGQSTGSTTYNGTDVDLVGEAAATMVTTAGGVTLQRSTSQASASIPWTVIDFTKNCAGQ